MIVSVHGKTNNWVLEKLSSEKEKMIINKSTSNNNCLHHLSTRR
jgi:hypothetical protein